MATRFSINGVLTNTDSHITLPTAGVTCIVGANNAGKSQMLRDMYGLTTIYGYEPKALNSIYTTRPSYAPGELKEFLERNAGKITDQTTQQVLYGTPGHGMQSLQYIEEAHLRMERQSGSMMAEVGDFYINLSPAGSAGGFASVPTSTGYGQETAGLGRLLWDGDMEEELSDLLMNTFGLPVTLNRLGSNVTLRVGKPGVPAPPISHPTPEYARAVDALQLASDQGDGFRNFAGIALHVLTRTNQVLLIDEPEAFLHPAQARALGRWLAGVAARGNQIVLATHDRDLVLGLIESGAANVNLVRLSREGNDTHLRQLVPAEVETVWANPVLRYSNVLQGLFHSQVVICEGDADCRFYAAALSELANESGQQAKSDNTLFVPTGGKGQVPAMATALASLGVASRTILDFDVLRKRQDIKSIVTALDHVWTDSLDANYTTATRAIHEKFSNGDEAWKSAKNLGLHLLSGEALEAANDLLAELAELGVFVLNNGEIEDFDRRYTAHGPAWVTWALSEGVHKSSPVQVLVAPLLNDAAVSAADSPSSEPDPGHQKTDHLNR